MIQATFWAKNGAKLIKMTGDENQEYDRDSLPDLLPIYYKRLFPYGPYYKWLNYGGGNV